MAIEQTPQHVISVELTNQLAAVVEELNSSGDVTSFLSQLTSTFATSITKLETEVLRLRVLLDAHNILDFDAQEPSA